ncbi:MAG: hypothetical protein WBF90_14755 [Rivularia sp. (in: cyanobacteria)]|jgi:hypothetical protein
MKIKVFGFALLLGLATTLGACENTDTDTPATDTPAGEPAEAPATDATPEPTAAP